MKPIHRAFPTRCSAVSQNPPSNRRFKTQAVPGPVSLSGPFSEVWFWNGAVIPAGMVGRRTNFGAGRHFLGRLGSGRRTRCDPLAGGSIAAAGKPCIPRDRATLPEGGHRGLSGVLTYPDSQTAVLRGGHVSL